MTNPIFDELSDIEKAVDLRKKFPLSWRSIFRQSWLWLGIFVASLALVFLATSLFSLQSGAFAELLTSVIFAVIGLGLLLSALKIFYELLYHITYDYALEAGHLVVIEGVFLKTRSSFPLSKVTDVYLDRDFIDLCFLLWNVNVSTANPNSIGFGQIRGLSRKKAVLLQDYLTTVLDTVHPEIEKALEKVAG